MLGQTRRSTVGGPARLLRRAASYWIVAAVPVVATVAWHEWRESRRGADTPAASRSATHVALARRSVANALEAARSDMRLLGETASVADLLRRPEPVGRAAATRDLLSFVELRPWCDRLALATEVGAWVTAERRAGPSACRALVDAVAGMSPGQTLIDRVSVPDPGGVRLCLGLSLRSAAGHRGALVAEARPEALFADAAAAHSAGLVIGLVDARGLPVLAPGAEPGGLAAHPVALPSWNGPASGTWRLSVGAPPEPDAPRSRHEGAAALALPLLLAAAAGSLVMARSAEARLGAERAARRQLDQFQLVSDNVPTPIFLKDREGRYLLCNQAFERLVGRSREAILGDDLRALLPADEAERHRAVDEELLREGGTRQYEVLLRRHPRGPRDLVVAKSAVADEDGTVVGLTAAVLDITAIKAAEREQRRTLEALRQAKEAAEAGTRAKSDFLAVMSHEMRTPLHAVLGATGLLLDGALAPEQREQAEMARAAGRALLDLIDDLLDFSRIEAGRLDLERIAFDPRRLARDTVALVSGSAHDKGLALSCEVSSDVPGRVTGDPGRLRQVLLNLLSNAVKFTEQGAIRASLETAGRDANGLLLRLRVQDTGAGIDPDAIPHLFEPFRQGEGGTRRRHGGVGLGLAITRRLVDLMGGEIEVTSAPGEGSEFRCTIRLGEPADGEPLEDEEPAAEPERGPSRSAARVLLVEDNVVNQRVTRAQLERLGCTVDVAADGQEAIRAASARRYDLVFMDCQMPGMDGFEATREIRRREEGGVPVPIVALTANALRGDRERCLVAGMSDYVAKPTSLDGLASVLHRHAGAASRTGPSPVLSSRPTPLVDEAALAVLRSLEKEGPGFLASIVHEFDSSVSELLVDMQTALRDQDPATLRHAAHSLKGSAGIIGAHGMADLCRRIEGVAGEGPLERARDLVARLAHEREAVLPVLREAATPP